MKNKVIAINKKQILFSGVLIKKPINDNTAYDRYLLNKFMSFYLYLFAVLFLYEKIYFFNYYINKTLLLSCSFFYCLFEFFVNYFINVKIIF